MTKTSLPRAFLLWQKNPANESLVAAKEELLAQQAKRFGISFVDLHDQWVQIYRERNEKF